MTSIEEGEVLDLLTALVDKSLVLYEEDEKGVGRYRLLETVRQYARDRLHGGEQTVSLLRDRHRDFYLAFAEEAEPHLTGREQVEWLERLERKHENLRAALEWSIESEAEVALRLAGAVWRFWEVHGHFAEGQGWLERALEGGKEASAALRAKALSGAGTMAWLQSDFERATALHEEALTLYREVEDKHGVAFALNNLGVQAANQGDYERAMAFFEGSMALYRELGDKWGIAFVLNNLGVQASEQGDYERARALYEECLALYREMGDKHGAAKPLSNLGNVAKHQGDYERARVLYEECLALCQDLGHKQNVAISLCALGEIATEQGDYARDDPPQGEPRSVSGTGGQS